MIIGKINLFVTILPLFFRVNPCSTQMKELSVRGSWLIGINELPTLWACGLIETGPGQAGILNH